MRGRGVTRQAVKRRGLLVAAMMVLGACGGGGGGGGGGGNGGGAGPSRSISKAAAPNGDGQTDTVRAVLAESLRVLVTEDGAAKAGVTVNWAAQSGGLVNPAASLTDAAGLAATRWKLGQTSGPQGATATLAGATGSPVTFSATVDPGAPVSLVKLTGDSQFAFKNAPLGVIPTVKMVDQFGNPARAAVTWSVLSGQLSLADSVTTTDGAGVARVLITTGNGTGPASFRASSSGLPGVNRDFSLTVISSLATVNVGNDFFESSSNSGRNPAVDTVQMNGVVRWDLVAGGHTVQSVGTPSFASSNLLQAGIGYRVLFTTVGTYQYQCGIHGAGMNGTIVVIP